MAASLSLVLAEYIESLNLGLLAYPDGAPDHAQRPYVTFARGISVTPDGYADAGEGETATEVAQVDLWEDWRDADDNLVESPTLADDLARRLHGAHLVVTAGHVYGISFVSKRRLLESRTNTVHSAITVNVYRNL